MNTLQHPNEALRKKLVIAGIPESEHSRASLAAKMPDFEGRELEGISVDMLAELLLCGRNQAEIMFGVLIVIFRSDRIA